MCKQMEIRINMKLCTTHSLSVCVASCRLAHSVAAAVLKDELVIGTVRTTRIHKQTVGSHSSCLCFLSLAPAFFFIFVSIRGAFPQAAMCFQSEANYSPPLVLFPAHKKKKQRAVYTLQAFSHLSAVDAQSD